MKTYKRKADMVQAFRYTGDVEELKKQVGSAFVKEEEKPSDPTDVAVKIWNQSAGRWELLTPHTYVIRNESGSYERVTAGWFDENYEELDLSPSYPSIITYPPGVRGCNG